MTDSGTLRLPPDASDDEAAAITAAAVEQWLAAEARTGEADRSPADPWNGRRFGFAGRTAKLRGESIRVPKGAPADPWTALDRLGQR